MKAIVSQYSIKNHKMWKNRRMPSDNEDAGDAGGGCEVLGEGTFAARSLLGHPHPADPLRQRRARQGDRHSNWSSL